MDNKKDLAYYLTLYKLEGHETWRANLSGDANGFHRYRENEKKQGVKIPNITEIQVLRIDRITGTFSQRK